MPLVPYSDWKNPTDHAYAFRLRAVAPSVPSIGTRSDIRAVCSEALEDPARFAEKVGRWTGPEDEVEGARPYAQEQLWFEERGEVPRLGEADLEALLRGTVLVLKTGARTDYVMRDHHTLDAVLYHWRTRGELPRRLFHADRHSDWCKDSYLEARRPEQAATWWRLLEGLKRPDGKPVLREQDVLFTTALAPRTDATEGRDIGASTRVPGCVDSTALDWRDVLERPELEEVDWVSIDLDYLQPAAQLRLTAGLLRDPRFAALLHRARVGLFVLSPQFLAGGDRFERWELQGGLHSALRLLNLIRRSR